MENNFVGGDVFFLLMGAILVFAMHAGLLFSKWARCGKNQVNAMVKIISDFAMSTIAYFFHWLFGRLWRRFSGRSVGH